MPTTLPINLSQWSKPIASVSITAIIRSDNGSAPAGQTFPIVLTVTGNTTATGTFVDDNAPPSFYLASGVATFTDESTGSFNNYQINGSASPVSGYFTSQTEIERYLGSFNADMLSNADNTTQGADPTGFSDAIANAEAEINYELALFSYPTAPSFPTTSFAFPILQRTATILASCWLYGKRGIDDSGKSLAGAFAKAEAQAKDTLNRIIRNKIGDVPRSQQGYPTIILNPALYPFGTSKPVPLTADMIPQLP